MVTKSDHFGGFGEKRNPASVVYQLLTGFGCTRNRGRTGTGISAHRILSPACLPIPPSEPLSLLKDGANVQFLFYSAKFSASISLLSEFTVDKISRRNDTGVTFFSITSI